MLATTMPNSAIRPRSWLITMVRCLISSARSLCSPAAACWASLLTATKRIDGRLTASQIAAASAASFLLRRT